MNRPAPLFSLDELATARALVAPLVPSTPVFDWPLLAARAGLKIWVKHENHTRIGSFKLRGGLTYLDALMRAGEPPRGVVTATRGNHGQSVAFAASRFGIPATIVVPIGNSSGKNAAMEGFGAELVIEGRDFDESRVTAARIADERGYHFVPSFHPALVKGVATYAFELFAAAPSLAAVYVPIGMGSGICGLITVRDLLGLDTEIVGVVAEGAPAYADSFAAGRSVPAAAARTFADGMACRQPDALALAIIRAGAARLVRVTEDELAAAVRMLHECTHNAAEGAGAAALAALMQERNRYRGREAAIVLSGGNIDAPLLAEILAGRTPAP